MSVSFKVIKSALLLLGTQIIQRGLGIVSTLVLARLLTPADFGIIALITITLQFFELLVETGNQQYIVQKETVDDNDLNTAWTMDILIKSAMALVIIGASPWLSVFFEEPELGLAISIAAIALPLRAMKNPGLMQLVRDINYRPLFTVTIWQKGLSFCAVMAFALVHASYWAIVFGNLVSAMVLVAGSYKVHAYRPNVCLRRVREQWRFSQWLLLRGIVGFTRSQVDNLIVSKAFGTTALGGYNLVREISLLPALSIIIPMSEPLLASTSQAKNDATRLAYRVRLSHAVMMTALLPITAFLMLFPELTVNVLLGHQWQDYSELLRPFGLLFFTFSLFAVLSDTVIALGRVKALLVFDVISTAIIFSLLLAFGTESLMAMAWARGWLAVATTVALLLIVAHWTGFGLPQLAYLLLPAGIGVSIAGTLSYFLDLPADSEIVEFLVRGTVFVGLYTVLLALFARLLLSRREEWWQIRSIIRQAVPWGRDNATSQGFHR